MTESSRPTARGPKDPRALAQALPSTACARLLVAFALKPERQWGVRELIRVLRLSPRSVTTELRRLVQLGAIEGPSMPGRTGYRAVVHAEAWQCFRRMVRTFAVPDEVLSPAFSTVPGVDSALLFGSFASGTERDDSDLDVLVFGDRVDGEALSQATAGAGRVLGRDINPIVLSQAEWRGMIDRGDPFALNVLRKPRVALFGPGATA